MPCPACKIILNGGFMAVLAHHLAQHCGKGPVAAGAASLADAARILTGMLATAGLKMDPEHLAGCNQATLLVKWIREGITESERTDVLTKLNEWYEETWGYITDLAAGKLPSDHATP